ncbi:MAG: hypothetical protein PHF25_00410 [Candidatus Margulisbacteria bacterium]|nr:hypothetical protein [Candidatus Margulisiibacteriota bacterium]
MNAKIISLAYPSGIGSLLDQELKPIINFFQEQISIGNSVFQQRIDELQKMLKGLRRCDNLIFRDFLSTVDMFDDRQEISLLSIKRGLSIVEFRQYISDFANLSSIDIDSWVNDFCITQDIVNSDGNVYKACTLRSDLSEDDLSRADTLIPELYNYLLNIIEETEDYLYYREDINESKINIDTDVFKALILSEPVKPVFGQKAIFSWNHTHPTRSQEVQSRYSKRSGYFFSVADLKVVNEVERNAEVFSAYGASFVERDNYYEDINGNKAKLTVSPQYISYVARRLAFLDAYRYISKVSKLSSNVLISVALEIANYYVGNRKQEDVQGLLEKYNLEPELIEKFKKKVFDSGETSELNDFFGMHANYPEVAALKEGHVSYFVNRSMINRMMDPKRTELGDMKYHEAIEFIKLRSSKTLRLILCAKYDLSDLFIRDRKFLGNRIVSVSAKQTYMPLLKELWNSKNLTEAREARDKILKAFYELDKSGELYED